MRFDIVSDTHGHLSQELLKELQGADYIVHAGDICSEDDFYRLMRIARLHMCLGNNDWSHEYGHAAKRVNRFTADGLRWEVCHYRERLDLSDCDIAICGHTHRPFIEHDEASNTLIMNPGSPTFPRTNKGPTIGRIITKEGKILLAEIIELDRQQ